MMYHDARRGLILYEFYHRHPGGANDRQIMSWKTRERETAKRRSLRVDEDFDKLTINRFGCFPATATSIAIRIRGIYKQLMPLLSRVYFNSVFGALGGLVGWFLFGVFGDPRASDQLQWLLGGAILGGSIGYFVVSVEAILDRSLLR